MKLLSYEVLKSGADRRIVSAQFLDRMKRPTAVKITIEPTAASSAQVVEGDVAEVGETLGCLATIAWNEFGWRPKGLMPVLIGVIDKFKAPKG